MLNQRILKTYGDDPVKDVAIETVNQTTEVTNEMFSTVFQKDSPETGYDKFHLDDIYGLETPLEETVLERGKEKLTQVQDFKVAEMYSLLTEVRCQFVDFAAEVIEQHQSEMTDIDFTALIYYNEVTPSDTRLVDALCNSGWTQLRTLKLGGNKSWFEDPTMHASLFDFVKSQTSLVTLDLTGAYLSSSETTEVFQFLCQSGSVATLQDLNMQLAANFSSDESCQYLALLIDTALALKKINIRGQVGEREVKLLLEYTIVADPADDSVVPKQGSIKVVDRRDESKVICERSTKRTETNKVEIEQD